MFSDPSDSSNPSQNEVILPSSESDFYPAARPLSTIPIPPVPRVLQSNHIISTIGRVSESESISSSMGDSLNPDVPEFIPNELTSKSNEPVGENSESEQRKNKQESQTANSISASSNNDFPPFPNNDISQKNDKSSTDKCSSPAPVPEAQVNGESPNGDVWKEVSLSTGCILIVSNNQIANNAT